MLKGETMKMSIALGFAVAVFAVQGGAMLECSGLVTEKVAGWRFEASE